MQTCWLGGLHPARSRVLDVMEEVLPLTTTPSCPSRWALMILPGGPRAAQK